MRCARAGGSSRASFPDEARRFADRQGSDDRGKGLVYRVVGVRVLRSFLVGALLAPLLSLGLVLSGPIGSAVADDFKYGSVVQAEVKFGFISTFPATCHFAAYYKVGTVTESVKFSGGYCSVAPSSLGLVDMSDTNAVFTFKGADTVGGAACSISSGPVILQSFFAGEATTALTTSCGISEVCMDVDVHNYGPDADASACAGLTLGPVPAAPSSGSDCPDASVTSVDLWIEESGGMAYVKMKVSGAGKGATPRKWYAYSFAGNDLGSGVQPANSPTVGAVGSGADVAFGQTFVVWQGNTWNSAHWSQHWVNGVGGVQLYPAYVAAEGYTGHKNLGNSFPEKWLIPESAKGYTRESACTWWAGQDLGNTGAPLPLNSTDSGGVDPAPADPDESVLSEGCDFSVLEPGTWLEGGMCAAVGALQAIAGILVRAVQLLGQIAGYLADLAGSIAGAILGGLGDLLTGLFVPGDGFLDAAFGDLRDDWEGTSPVLWLAAVDGFAPPAMSGCGGVRVVVPLPGGAEFDEYLGEACSGPVASGARLVRLALSGIVVVGGGLACLRALGAGFGWSVQARGDG